MNQAPLVENTAVAGLLRLLDASGDEQCSQLRAKAAAQIAEIRRLAYQQARQRIRTAVAEERTRIRQEVGRVEAEVETELRRGALRHDARLVDAGREGLEQALRERWRDEGSRQAWVDAVLTLCEQVVIGREWILSCPSDWPQAERERAIEQARERAGAALIIEEDVALEQGFRVCCGGVSVDMSVAGLLVDRAAIEGALLHLNRCVRQGEPE